MNEKIITVTEAARNFADCVNRAHYQNITFILLKNGVPFARITPEPEKICTGRDLAAALEGHELYEEDSRAWLRELQVARENIKPPIDKWQ